jgi:hypothetical protein
LNKFITIATLVISAFATSAYAADAACEAKATEKKLAGAAKNSFVKKCVKDSSAAPAAAASGAKK